MLNVDQMNEKLSVNWHLDELLVPIYKLSVAVATRSYSFRWNTILCGYNRSILHIDGVE